jgi:hypothetical protein
MRHDGPVSSPAPVFLESAAAAVEAHVGLAGWGAPPSLFALVRAAQFAADEPETAARLGLDAAVGDALTPIDQEGLPEGALDEALAGIAWPESVTGCALSQEILLLPPSAEADVPDGPEALSAAVAHPQRREARLVVAVLRDGSSAGVLRLRGSGSADGADGDAADGADGADGAADELLTGPDLAPNLVEALLATLR